MDDAEAEAVLLALGDPLMWNLSTMFKEEQMESAKVERGEYCIRTLKPKSQKVKAMHAACFFAGSIDTLEYSPYNFRTRLAAKAACERHYATGKWE